MPEVKNIENEQLNVLKIVVDHRVDEHIEDATLCRTYIDPIIVERAVVHAMFLEFIEDLDNLTEGSSSMGKNSGTAKPFATSNPRRCA
ncbi:uncharacterized protein E5676_scaffold668G00140 [Cucumis melo var. makuwa]|uniref:CACTA en-spm transposon protein n=1 Tax=Cucumis melo var. makuwa TaxID=1194695 RepID=A0A5A7T5L8_CUCMM|nr:uncharacterized protein E6C27_scaffold3921G00190 [Cucumis melo var. makuwa]TYK25999.1 uncharacterized protein E5676_scaffold668G00140 [Cucumis melo var. makuwa]